MNSFAFFNHDMGISDFKNRKIPDDCIKTSWGEIIKIPKFLNVSDYIRIQSGAETIYLDKMESEWPVSDKLIEEDMSWWTKFKRKFKNDL